MNPDNEIFWHKPQNCPVVYVASICCRKDAGPLMASSGMCWGFEDTRNSATKVNGEQTEMRGELTGLFETLQLALKTRIAKLVIRMRWQPISDELDRWEIAKQISPRDIPNFELLYDIEELLDQAKEYMYWIEEPLESQMPGIDFARQMAQISLIGPSSIASLIPPMSPPPQQQNRNMHPIISKKEKSAQCAIIGVCAREGSQHPKATYATYWGYTDKNNRTGEVTEEQTSLRGELFALRSALTQALADRITCLQVLTRSLALRNYTDNFHLDKTEKRNTDLIRDCREMAYKLKIFDVKLVEKGRQNEMLDAVKTLSIRYNQSLEAHQKRVAKMEQMMERMVTEDERIPVMVRTVSSPCNTPRKAPYLASAPPQPQPAPRQMSTPSFGRQIVSQYLNSPQIPIQARDFPYQHQNNNDILVYRSQPPQPIYPQYQEYQAARRDVYGPQMALVCVNNIAINYNYNFYY